MLCCRYGDQGNFYPPSSDRTGITDNDSAMVFTAFYVAYGIFVISVVLGLAIEKLMDVKQAAMKTLQGAALDAILNDDVPDCDDDTKFYSDAAMMTGKKDTEPLVNETTKAPAKQAFVCHRHEQKFISILLVLAIFFTGILVMMAQELSCERFVSAFYWLVVTGTTVG